MAIEPKTHVLTITEDQAVALERVLHNALTARLYGGSSGESTVINSHNNLLSQLYNKLLMRG